MTDWLKFAFSAKAYVTRCGLSGGIIWGLTVRVAGLDPIKLTKPANDF